MRKLEEFVIEKLKVTKASGVPNLISILESANWEEYNSQYKNLLEYFKYDSNLPIAEIENLGRSLKSLSRKYANGNETFLWFGDFIFYGDWDNVYCIQWSKLINRVKNTVVEGGFKSFLCNENELMKSKGVFIVSENEELMEQINYLMQKAEPSK